jgi:DNA polymerase theta
MLCGELQAECLNQPSVLNGSNLVYCAPTSGGKSLVAEVLMLRRVVATGKAALLVSTSISL